ncbi:hypothetical protein [Bosea sp. TAB14]|uniref:hypothetical protein n=1 Tax=Bosea sp. TAB14 TaxID=3237481 RepID=UPI003F919055
MFVIVLRILFVRRSHRAPSTRRRRSRLGKTIADPEDEESDLVFRDGQTGIKLQGHAPSFAGLLGVKADPSLSGAGYRAIFQLPRLRARHAARGGAWGFDLHSGP